MGKNALVVMGFELVAYNCYADSYVFKAYNARFACDEAVALARDAMSAERKRLEKQGFTREQIAKDAKYQRLSDAVKAAQNERSEAERAFYHCGDYIVNATTDVLGYEVPEHVGNVFADMFDKYDRYRKINPVDSARLVHLFGLVKDFEAKGAKVAEDIWNIMNAIFSGVKVAKTTGSIRGGVYNAREHMLSEVNKFKSGVDVANAFHGVLTEVWSQNKHFTRSSNGMFSVPKWAIVEGHIDTTAEIPEKLIVEPTGTPAEQRRELREKLGLPADE